MSNTQAIVFWNAFIAASFSTRVLILLFVFAIVVALLLFLLKVIAELKDVVPEFFCARFFKILGREMLFRKDASKAERVDRLFAFLLFGLACMATFISMNASWRCPQLLIVVGGAYASFVIVLILSVWIVSKEEDHSHGTKSLHDGI